MKIKTKLTLWVGLLFALIIFLSVIGITQIESLAVATEKVLEDNYNTLDYARQMLNALEEVNADPAALELFDEQLKLQEANITETGEEKLTGDLRAHFNQLRNHVGDTSLMKSIRQDIHEIMNLNLEAIDRKSKVAAEKANQAILYIPAAAGLCFVIAFILLLNLPGNIANPIRELSESIKQIASQKYSQRVQLDAHDEFGELASSFNIMAGKLEEYNNSNLAKIMMEKKRVETLINNMHDPVIGLDDEKKVIFANEEALSILALNASDIQGKPVESLAVTSDLIRMLIRDLYTESRPSHPVPIKIYAHGKESYFEKEVIPIQIIPTGEAASIHIGDVIILRNVTSYKELDEAKTNFMATLSHEFKTPIASIRMSLALLQREDMGGLNDQQKELLHSIDEDASRLLKITGEILNLSQVEAGKIELRVSPQDPEMLMNNAIESNKIIATQKDVVLVKAFQANMGPVIADQEKTVWILSNLIGNAIRYSYEHASVILSIREEGEFLRFSVKDHGIGIAPEYVGKIFDRYFRIPGTEKEGTGLGLAISKELIEAQGGHIQVESELGAGSTFSFTLLKQKSV
jgi:signal transduction histidine kinase